MIRIHVGGVWQDISDDALISGGTTVKWGSSDGEQHNRGPATCTLRLDNDSGRYSPENPESDLYGLFGRGTRVDVTVDGQLRFDGVIESFEASWSQSESDHAVAVECAGIRQRLGANARPLKTTLERGMPTMAGVVGYWPMTGGKYTQEFQSAIGGAPSAQATPWSVAGAVRRGSNNEWPAAGEIPTFKGSAQVTVDDLPSYATTGRLRMMAFVAVPDDLSSLGVAWATLMTLRTTVAANRQWHVRINGAGSLSILVQSDDDLASFTSGEIGFGLTGRAGLVWIYLVNGVSGTVNWQIGFADAAGTGGALAFSADLSGSRFAGTATGWRVGQFGALPDTLAIGHVSIHSGTDFWSAVDFARSFQDERASTRFARLCAEEGVTMVNIGASNTARMGPQETDTFLDMVDDCALADDAVLYDSPTARALVFRRFGSLYEQPSTLTLDYATGHLSPPLQPVVDNRLTRNDVTVERENGSKARVVDSAGSLGTNTLGAFTDSLTVNFAADAQALPRAQWELTKGTAGGIRVQRLTVDVVRWPALAAAALAVQPGTFVSVVNLPRRLTADPLRLLVLGVEEFADESHHTLTFVTAPGHVYDVGYTYGNASTDARARVDLHDCTVFTVGFVTGTSTSLVVNVPGRPWTTAAADLPFSIRVSGAVLTVTAVSAVVSSQQGFTVSTTVGNGVVKTLPASSPVHIEPGAVVATV